MALDRFEYWNSEYPAYWLQRVAEAEEDVRGKSKLVEDDSKVPDSEVLNKLLDLMPVTSGQCVLDLACGFGRAFPYLLRLGTEIVGVDISFALLNLVPNSLKSAERVRLGQVEAEGLPFVDGTFDHVLVMAAFDTFQQHIALSEMLRVCRTGGYLFFSGKHSWYCEDDEQALIAERNARRKGHPNYFTDFNALVDALEPLATIRKVLYFVRREDFTPFRYLETRPTHFYNYVILAQRSCGPAYNLAKPIAS